MTIGDAMGDVRRRAVQWGGERCLEGADRIGAGEVVDAAVALGFAKDGADIFRPQGAVGNQHHDAADVGGMCGGPRDTRHIFGWRQRSFNSLLFGDATGRMRRTAVKMRHEHRDA